MFIRDDRGTRALGIGLRVALRGLMDAAAFDVETFPGRPGARGEGRLPAKLPTVQSIFPCMDVGDASSKGFAYGDFEVRPAGQSGWLAWR